MNLDLLCTKVIMQKLFELVLFLLLVHFVAAAHDGRTKVAPFHVGVVLDLDTLVGKMGMTSISMAVNDFYALHGNYSTRLVLHFNDSGGDVVRAASEALDLMENVQVEAIIGPQKSGQAVFISEIGKRIHVPIISFSATSPSLSSVDSPYFVRTTLNDSFQVNAISSIIKAFGWREVVPIYENTDYGRGVVPFLVDSLQAIDARIPYRSIISLSATDDQITEELYKLMSMQTRVFILHVEAHIGIRFFLKAKEAGMISEGYVWIMTDGLTNIVDSFDSSITDTIQGALGIKVYVPKSRELETFNTRWKRRFRQENPNDEPAEMSNFGLWAYDTVWALAMAAEKVGPAKSHFQRQQHDSNLVKLEAMPVSETGAELLKAILDERFRGLSGEFQLIDGQLQASTIQIINVVGRGGRGIGYWTPASGLSRQLNASTTKTYSTLLSDLNPIIWPGESTVVPKGWEIPVSGMKLRIGVPISTDGLRYFVNVQRNPVTNEISVTGYCIDVFEAVVKRLPYALTFEYIPFENAHGQSAGTFDDLVYQIEIQKYDAVVGDVTIRANRSLHADFTLPYTESGVSMLVPIKDSVNKNAWIFLKPLTADMWLGSFAFFLFTGFVVWVLEHRINREFRGPPSQQLGTIFYFSLSTLVFAHREKVENILSRIVMIIWVFVVLILTSSYTASLTSMLTVQQFQPTVTTVDELLENGDYVGYPRTSFIKGLLLEELHFDKSKIRAYDEFQDIEEALSKGSKNGGVSAFVHEIPYLKLFLAQHCTGYTTVGPIYKTAGFGFAFPKGSPLVHDISQAILNVTDGDIIIEIEKKWFGDQSTCLNQGSTITSNSLSFRSFWGLFLITGTVSCCALLIFLSVFFYDNWHQLKMIDPDKPISRRLIAWLNYFDKKDSTYYTFAKDKSIGANGGVSISCRQVTCIGASNVDDPESCLSISEVNNCQISDVNNCPEDNNTSIEIASPSTNTHVASEIATSK